MSGITAALAQTVNTPYTEPGAVFVSQAILLFGLLALAFVALHTKRSTLWWVGAVVHVGAGALLPYTANMAGFFVIWELVTVGAAIVLVCEPDADGLLRRYLPWQLLAAALLLSGFALQFAESGSIALPAAGVTAGRVLIGIAVAIKAALMPLHLWMVETYVRVRPGTAVILSAVATKIGVFGVYRLLPGSITLEILGGIIATVAVLYALRQNRLRPFLAFHIISQVGYMIAGVGSAAAVAQIAGLYHLGNPIAYKGLLFMVVALMVPMTGTSNIYSTRGMGRRSFVLTVAAIAGALSISGVPPFNGYISKSLLQSSLVSPVAVHLLTIAGIGTALSFTKFLWHGFLRPGPLPQAHDVQEGLIVKTGTRTITAVLSLLCLLMGLYPRSFFAELPVSTGITGQSFLSGLTWPIAGAALFFILYGPILRVLLVTLPGSNTVVSLLRSAGTRGLQLMQRQHSGDIRRYLGWAVGGTLLLWTWVVLAP